MRFAARPDGSSGRHRFSRDSFATPSYLFVSLDRTLLIQTSITLRNTRGIDILASNKDATKSVGIQVKTSQRSTPDWVMSKKAEQDVAENLFYVFVSLPPGTPASFHIVPRKVVGQYVRDTHREWLATPGKQGQAHRDSDVRVFSDRPNNYKDRWDLLGLE